MIELVNVHIHLNISLLAVQAELTFGLYLVSLAGLMTDELRSFLELNLPKVKEGKKSKFSLGVAEPKLGSHISETTKITCQSGEFVLELLRGVRLHFDKFIKELKVCTHLLFSLSNRQLHVCVFPIFFPLSSCFSYTS